ncbi:MAG TPA: anti-sigma factor [Kofleriaceae bacterium]|nr:anti-sigma factor [Kofleriaceae bacterium]
MIEPCPARDELVASVDGEVTANRAAAIERHAATCAACRAELGEVRRLIDALAAPVPGIQPDATRRLLDRLDGPEPAAPGVHRAGTRAVAATAAVAAVLLGVFAVQRLSGTPPEPAEDAAFRPRGAPAASSLQRRVGVQLYAVADRGAPLAAGAAVAPDAAFVASYRNLGPADRPVFLLQFAVDAAGTVHWLYPAYTDPASDPPALRLAPSAVEAWLADSVVLDGPAPGPMRVITMVAPASLRVSAIEALSPDARELERLRARWPEAVIDELLLRVTGAAP